MINQICTLLENKKILILGYGKEGKSTYRFLRKHFPDKVIGIYDKNPVKEDLPNVVIHGGATFHDILTDYDLVIKSPGIVIEQRDSGLLSRITSQTDLFLEFYSTQTIGITGTKGKSTTTSLLYHILHNSGKDAILVGNIGIPVFDELENIQEGTLVVYELSSHQLEYVKHAPHMGVILNVYQEHLDHYGTFEKYKSAKENIYRFQQKGDIFLYNKEFINAKQHFAADTITISYQSEDADVVVKPDQIIYQGAVLHVYEDEIQLKGLHNLYNAGAAYTLAKACGVSDSEFLAALKTFRPLPHRMEYVAEVDGVKYYNDSISTCCETTIQGVNSLKNVSTVILGGMDRGIAYEPLADFLMSSTVSNIILMPDTGHRIQKLMLSNGRKRPDQKLYMVSNVEEAVAVAKKETRSGNTCLFSPAAASYGFFKNFEERGEAFKQLVLRR